MTLIQAFGVIIAWLMAITLGALIANIYHNIKPRVQTPIQRWVAWEMKDVDTEYQELVKKK